MPPASPQPPEAPRDWHVVGESSYVVRAALFGEAEHELTGFVDQSDAPDNVLVARLTFLTRQERGSSPNIKGFSWSEQAGCYFYPTRVAKGGFFRIAFDPPRHIATVVITFERWRRGFPATFRVADIQLTATENGRAKAIANQKQAAERDAQRLDQFAKIDEQVRLVAEQNAHGFLQTWKKPLYPDDVPYLQALIRQSAALSTDARLREQLSQRFLWAGRFADEPELQFNWPPAGTGTLGLAEIFPPAPAFR